MAENPVHIIYEGIGCPGLRGANTQTFGNWQLLKPNPAPGQAR